jgi:SNF2 family DNA or RNA helicase
MLSVKLSGTVLHVKLESYLGGNEYKNLMQLLGNLPGAFYWEEKYTWIVPKQYVDDLINIMGEDKIAWFNSIEEIKGIRESIIPQFEVSHEGLDDMHLTPYPFQGVGISFLHDIKQGLLADEMGLGKTPQAIGAIHRLWKEGKVRKALVVCPTSLKYQWATEIEKFTDHKGIVIDGTPKQRKEQLHEFATSNEYLFAIINYELVRNDLALIKGVKVDAIAADEVHRIKNWKSKTSAAMKELDAPYKFGLTGTPMQNKPDELWNVMDWLNPTILGNYWAFRNRYVVTGEKFGKKNVEIGYKRLGELRRRVAPFMLRRMKVDVAPELPEMIFNTYRVEMTPEQAKIQETIQTEFMDLLKELKEFSERTEGQYNDQGEWVQPSHPKEGQMMGFFNMMLAVSDAPELLLMSESKMAQRYAELITSDKPKSPKLDELEKVCQDNMEAGNTKIVIFTQFARMQQLAVERLMKIGGVEVINGSMKPAERQAALDNFKYNESINFMVCTDAANYGLNMQFANVLIHLELPWNPAVKDQRDGRVHRIGSEHSIVNIIHILTQGGIDEKVEEALYRKRELAGQIVEKNDEERAQMNRLTSGFLEKLMKGKKKKK